jgi:hypothetical protein
VIPGATGDSKMIEYGNDRVHGKPTAKSEIDLKGKLELPNQRLTQFHIIIMQVDGAVREIDTIELKKRILLAPVDDTGHAGANVPS